MKKHYIITLLSICTFALPCLAQVDLGMAYSYPVGSTVPDGDLKVVYKPEPMADYSTSPKGVWNNAVFTVSWPQSLGTVALGNISSLSGISFAKVGPVEANPANNKYYQIVVASSSNIAQAIPMGGSLDVVLMDITTAFITLPDFKLDTGLFVDDIYGTPSVNNIIDEQFRAFNPANVTAISLPVEMMSFNLKKISNQEVQLNWQTASEINNDYFSVERSQDPSGDKWQPIGKLNGYGNSSERQAYTFTDYEPYLGINYYRLVQYDFDGRNTKTEALSVLIDQLGDQTTVQIMPNPAQNYLKILLNDSPATTQLSITDVCGRVIYSTETENSLGSNTVLTINTSVFEAGTYFLTIEIEGQKTQHLPFVKN